MTVYTQHLSVLLLKRVNSCCIFDMNSHEPEKKIKVFPNLEVLFF
jgi:hypothetical protein